MDGLDVSDLTQSTSQEEPEYTITYDYVEYVESWTVVVEDAVTGPAIEDEMEYNGVTVYVYAPENAFPEGTVLNIRPVVQAAAPLSLDAAETADTSAEDVAQAVADAMQAEEVDPMSMVAFDITFTDAEGNELQPTEAVSVQFDVAASSDLITEETGALQVYHVETDEDKAPVSAQPVDTATEVEDTSADQTVVVEAESFSIYAITSVKKGNQNVSITPGETVELTGASGSGHSWFVYDTGVVQISSGSSQQRVNLKAVGVGETTVTHSYRTYSYWDGWTTKTETFTVTVSEGWVVTFDDVSGTLNIDDQIVANGEKASEPWVGNNGWGNCTFGGWYTTPDCTEEFYFDTPITADTTVYAKWTANAMVFTLLTNKVPQKNEINKGWEAGLFGPSRDDTPYFRVDVNMTKLLHTKKVTKTNESNWYISIATAGCGFDNAEDLWKVIFSCLSEQGKKDFQTFFPGSVGETGSAFVGYVLKQQGDGSIHIDGVTTFDPPAYMVDINARLADQSASTLEPLFAENVTNPATKAPKYPDVVDRVEDYFDSIGATNVTWNQEENGGTYTVGSNVYDFKLTQTQGSRYGDTIDYVEKTKGSLYYAQFELTSRLDHTITSTVEVTKTVSGLSDLNGYQVSFKVYAAEDTSYAEVLSSGTASLFDGNSATVTLNPALPAGNYVLVEEPAAVPNYSITKVTGTSEVTETETGNYWQSFTVPADGSEVELSFANTYEADTTDYTFTKVWNGTPTSFVVTLEDRSGKGYPDLTVNVPATGDGTASGTDVSYTAKVDKIDKTWTITVEDVPADSDYYVSAENSVGGKTVINGTATVDANNWWTVSISGSTITNTHHKKVENQGTGTLYIYKTGADGHALKGVTFSLKGGTYDETATTGADGIAKFENIPVSASSYTLKEESAPADYNLIGTPWTVKVEKVDGTENVTPDTDGGKLHTYNHTAKVTVGGNEITEANKLVINNTKVQAKIQIQKSVDPEAAWASEYTFTIKNGETTVATLKLNDGNSWTAQTDNLPYGTYTITETNPGDSGDYKWNGVSYTGTGVTDNKNNTATVTIGRDDNGQTITVNAANSYSKLTDGRLKITKSAPNAPDGTKFQFEVRLGNSTDKKGTFTSDTVYNGDGVYTFNLGNDEAATITGILRGTAYTVSETGVVKADGSADAQALSDQYTTSTSGSTRGTISNNNLVTVTYTNTYVTQDVTFVKKDFDDKTIGLSGATFELRSGDTKVATATSAANGTVTFTDVPVGTYDLWETQAPTGYEPANKDTGIDVVVTKDSVTFREPGGVAAFIGGLLKTGEKMYDLNKPIPEVYNKHLKGTITIEKDTNPTTLTGEYEFTIYDENKNELTNVSPIKVDANGNASSTVTLNTGFYYIKETGKATQDKYDLTGTTYDVGTADQDGYVRIEVKSGENTAVVCTNAYTRKTGDLTISKTVTYGTDVPPANRLDADTEYSFVLEGPDGTHEEFTLIAGTNEVFTDLPTGEYTLKEVDPATGDMLLAVSAKVNNGSAIDMDDTSTTGTYVLGAQTLTKDADMTIEVTNHYELGSDHNRAVFQVKKTDATDDAVKAGAQFTLYKENPDNNPNAEVVATETTGENGLALFTLEQDVLGAYTDGTAIFYLKETKAPTGYEENDTVWTVTVTKEGGSYSADVELKEDGLLHKIWNWVVRIVGGTVTTEDGKPTLTVPNTRDKADDVVKPAYVYLLKVDGADQIALSGAVFTLTNVDDPSETIVSVDSTVAGETGVDVVTFDNTTTGMTEDDEKVYEIKETTPPTGYQAAKGPLGYVKVTCDSETELDEVKGQFVTTITYTADVYADKECETPATLSSGKLVVENDKLLNVTATKEWKDAAGNIITAPDGASVKFTLFYKVKDSVGAYEKATTAITAVPTITLNAADGWTATWTGLSPDYDYQVKETRDWDDYTALNDGIAVNGTITNKRDSNSLTITKTVTKDPATLPVDIPDDTTFTVYDETGMYTSFTYDEMEPKNGVMTMVLNNVPTGTYYVVETGADVTYYQLTVTGAGKENAATVDNGADDAVINITNEYEREPDWDKMTKLTIQKAVEDQDGAALSTTNSYYFKVAGMDVYGQTVTEYVTIALPADASGKTIDLPISNSAGYTVTEVTVASDSGVAVSTSNKPAAITNYDWTKVEFSGAEDASTAEGFQVALSEKNAAATVTATNTYTREVPPVEPPEDLLTTLTITKVVQDSRGGDLSALAAGKNYYFQITGEDVYDDAPLTQKVTITGATSTDVKLIWGEYEVTEVDASGNPINAGSAAEIDGYQWNKVEYTDNVDINLDKSTTAATATATNIYEPVPMDIPVVKTWSGDYSSLPNYIEVALYANGNDTGLRLTLDSGDRMDATHWLGVFKSTADHPLYRYENGGKEIVYSVVELSINGYAVNGNTLGYWTVTTGRTTAAAAGLTGYDDDATVLTVRNDYDLPDDDDDDDDDPTPSPSTEPTPSPSTEPTPSPSPSDEVEIPDDDTPLSDLPDEVPEDEVDIPDEDTPLSDQPDETDIFEEGVPMGDLPQTGSVGDYTAVDPAHTLGMLALAASLMAAGLLVLIGRRKDEETDQD